MSALCEGDRVKYGSNEGVVMAIRFCWLGPHVVVVEFEDGSRGAIFSSAVRKLEAA